MGGNFGNKNQNQDTDLITAVLAKEAGTPVKLEFTRKDDFVGMHGRWPTVQYYKVGVKSDGTLTAIQLRTISNMGPYRKNNGGVAGLELYSCANTESTLYPMYTNRTTSGNFRGPTDPQGYYPIQSMMDDIAYAMKLDPVDFIMKNMVKPGGPNGNFTNYTLDQCVRRGAELFEWKKRWKAVPGSDTGPSQARRRRGVHVVPFRRRQQQRGADHRLEGAVHAVCRRHRRRPRREDDDEHDRGRRARCVDGQGHGRLGRHRPAVPYSVGESGSRTTIQTGQAVIEAVRDLKKQIAEKGMPTGTALLRANASPTPRAEGKAARLLRRALRRSGSGHGAGHGASS